MPATNKVSIVQFCEDPNLLNIKLWDKQKEILTQFWSGDYRLGVWALGRRSGKTLLSAVSAVYAACVMADQYQQKLRKGENFYIISVANALDQAKLALNNVRDLIESSPILKGLITRSTSDQMELSNGAIFRALPSSSRTGRGMACAFLIMDEAAHFLDTDGNSAGDQLYQALSPSVAQFGELGKILLLSSPWIQNGIFWDLYKQADSGQYTYMQCLNYPTWEINPTISKEWLEQERARDPELFKVEFGAAFTGNVAGFLDSELIDLAINHDRRGILPPIPKFKNRYYLSLDPARGNRDDYTAVIAHYDDTNCLVIDLFYQFCATWSDGKKLQINVASVEDWILEHHRLYGFAEVCLDQYNSASTIQRLSSRLKIRELTWSAPNKTEAYSKLRQLFTSGKIQFYTHPKALQQIKNLTVKYRANGTWDVSGGTGAAVDDYPAALAGVVLISSQNSDSDWRWITMI